MILLTEDAIANVQVVKGLWAAPEGGIGQLPFVSLPLPSGYSQEKFL